MLKWILIATFIGLLINGAVNVSTTEEFFSINFQIESTLELFNTVKTKVVGFFNS